MASLPSLKRPIKNIQYKRVARGKRAATRAVTIARATFIVMSGLSSWALVCLGVVQAQQQALASELSLLHHQNAQHSKATSATPNNLTVNDPTDTQPQSVCDLARGFLPNIIRAKAELDYHLSKHAYDADALRCRADIELLGILLTRGEQDAKDEVDELAIFADEDDEVDALTNETAEAPTPSTESIYSHLLPKVDAEDDIPDLTADEAEDVARYVKQALTVTPNRPELHKFLCELYAMAGMKPELLAHLPIMQRNIPDDDSLVYAMVSFAQHFELNDKPDDALEVAKKIAELYPNEAYIHSELSGMYFRNRNLNKAIEYQQLALQKDNIGETDYFFAFFLQTVHGDYERAMDYLNRYSALRQDYTIKLFQGLLAYTKMEDNWRAPVLEYFALEPETDCLKIHPLMEFLLSEHNKNDYESYQKALSLCSQRYIQLMLHERAIRAFKGRIEPQLNYADALASLNYFEKAIAVLQQIEAHVNKENKKLSHAEKERLCMISGWAHQATGQIDKANIFWQQLLQAREPYSSGAAAYFYSKNLIQQNKTQEAQRVLNTAYSRQTNDKYTLFCRHLRNTIAAPHGVE